MKRNTDLDNNILQIISIINRILIIWRKSDYIFIRTSYFNIIFMCPLYMEI